MQPERFFVDLPHGTRLSCRAAGPQGAPLLLFLHGFPEAAFVWDEVLAHFAGRYRCVAPNLRGFEHSSAPTAVESYRAKHLVADVVALVAALAPPSGRLAALVAHDWGGAVAWNVAVAQPRLMERLVIINSPHPATFLRELQSNPVQQAASAYMNFLCRDDAAALLAENDYVRMWPFFTNMGALDASGQGWLTEAVREQYREVWRCGMQGGLNYYRASPLRPATADDDAVMKISFAPEFVTVRVPTRVIWGMGDVALAPGLLEGLDAFVPDLRIRRVEDATHWIVHERPSLVCEEIELELGRP